MATVADSNSSRTKSLDKYTIRATKATTKAQMIEAGGIHPAELSDKSPGDFIRLSFSHGKRFSKSYHGLSFTAAGRNDRAISAIPLGLRLANITRKGLQQITHHLNCQCPLALY